MRPAAKGWPTDVCVPISRRAETIDDAKLDLDASPLVSTILGRVGDGNFHVIFLFDPDERDEAARLNQRMIDRALAVGGTARASTA